jgi:hypothetical protein
VQLNEGEYFGVPCGQMQGVRLEDRFRLSIVDGSVFQRLCNDLVDSAGSTTGTNMPPYIAAMYSGKKVVPASSSSW